MTLNRAGGALTLLLAVSLFFLVVGPFGLAQSPGVEAAYSLSSKSNVPPAARLRGIIDASDRIVLGTVETVSIVNRPDAPDETVVKLDLSVPREFYFKGLPKDSKESVLNAHLKVALPPTARVPRARSETDAGTRLLLFLLPEVEKGAVSQTAGYYDGWFEVNPGDRPAPVGGQSLTYDTVMNLHRNAGLWNGPLDLWRQVGVDRKVTAVREDVKVKLWTLLEKDRTRKPADRLRLKDEFMGRGDSADPRGPLPLDLLIAALLVAY